MAARREPPRIEASARAAGVSPRRRRPTRTGSTCPAAIIFGVIFVVPTVAVVLLQPDPLDAVRRPSSSASTTSASSSSEPALTSGLRNTLVYAVVTSGLKVVLGLLLAVAAHLEHHRLADFLRVGRVLPGAGQHGRRRHHLRGADASVRRPDQRGARGSSASTGRGG